MAKINYFTQPFHGVRARDLIRDRVLNPASIEGSEGTLVGAFSRGILNKFLEPQVGAVLAKILVLVGIILFIQKRPRGLFALKGRAVES